MCFEALTRNHSGVIEHVMKSAKRLPNLLVADVCDELAHLFRNTARGSAGKDVMSILKNNVFCSKVRPKRERQCSCLAAREIIGSWSPDGVQALVIAYGR